MSESVGREDYQLMQKNVSSNAKSSIAAILTLHASFYLSNFVVKSTTISGVFVSVTKSFMN